MAAETAAPEAEAAPEADHEPEPAATSDPEAAPTNQPKADADATTAPVAEASADTEPKAEAEVEAGDDAAPAADQPAEAEAEPKAEAEAEAEADGEATPANETDGAPAEAEAKATAASAAEPEAEAKAAAESAPAAAPEAAAEPQPAAEPVAAAASAEPEAEAPAAEPKADAPAAEPEAKAEPKADAAAIPLADIESRAPGLVGAYGAAGEAIRESGLEGQRAVVYLVLDRSGSMRGYFKDGTVSHLAEQALALSARLDTSGTVPVVFFSTDIDGTADLELDRHTGRIEELHGSLGHMGRTNYHTAVNAVIEHYKASGATDPAFVIFQTDGAPTTKTAAEKALCEAAGLPLFWQFLAFGDPEAKGFDFLRKLETSPALAVPEKRAVDNTGFFHAGLDPRTVADAELYRELLKKFPGWLAAREQG
ncbi:VWA domain-containing protein [Streptomyces sp. PRKS01-29]|nr:VWA domain-containing protein [Streptomyces sabulosicollis]